MAIWLREREEFADNRFQLLFIYIDIVTMVKTYIIYSLSLPALTGYITLLLETIDEVRVS